MTKKAKRILLILALGLTAYLTLCALLATLYVFPPRIPVTSPPAPWTQTRLTTPDGIVLLDASPRPAAPIAAAILVHGYGATREDNQDLADRLYAAGFSVFNLQSRGQGDEPIRGVGFGYHESREVSAAITAARAQNPAPTPILLYGVSQGAAAVALAAANSPDQHLILVLDDPFARLSWAVEDSLGAPVLAPVSLIGGTLAAVPIPRVNPAEVIAASKRPTVILRSDNDQLFGPRHLQDFLRRRTVPVYHFPTEHAQIRASHADEIVRICRLLVQNAP